MERKLKRIGLSGLLCLATLMAWGQDTYPLSHLKTPKPLEKTEVKRLAGDERSTAFLIWIPEEVPAHYHATHSETVIILKGKGEMRLGEETISIRKGDLIFIPAGTPHAVKVTKGPLKVLSMQAPLFDGSDRIPVPTPADQ